MSGMNVPGFLMLGVLTDLPPLGGSSRVTLRFQKVRGPAIGHPVERPEWSSLLRLAFMEILISAGGRGVITPGF